MITICIKTKERRSGVDYLGQTLRNLGRGGVFRSRLLHSLIVVDSGSSDDYFERELHPFIPLGVPLIVDRGERTLHQTAATAIRRGATSGAPWVLVIEDDLDVCADFLGSVHRWLVQHAVEPGFRMAVFGANYSSITQLVGQATYWQYPVGAFYGAQALAWSRQDAAQLAAWLGPDPSYKGIRQHGHDILLQVWGRATGQEHFLASVPSFVQHVGRQSGISNKFFQFASWPGPWWSYLPPEPRKRRRGVVVHRTRSPRRRRSRRYRNQQYW